MLKYWTKASPEKQVVLNLMFKYWTKVSPEKQVVLNLMFKYWTKASPEKQVVLNLMFKYWTKASPEKQVLNLMLKYRTKATPGKQVLVIMLVVVLFLIFLHCRFQGEVKVRSRLWSVSGILYILLLIIELYETTTYKIFITINVKN
jgi:hypothetical protein